MLAPRLRPCFAPLLVLAATAPAFAVAAEPLPAGHPITAPGIEPEPMGLGYGRPARAGEPTILFVNFDGTELSSGCGNDPKNNCSTLAFTFGGKILPYEGGPGQRASLVQGVRADVADFGITVTDVRPPPTEDYAMVLVGKSATGGSMEHGFAGVAPTIDCGNSNPNITSFDLVGSITVINQEAAHTWGLEHVDHPADNLYPTSGGVSDPKYTDMCMKIVSDTDLTPSNGVCNAVHTQFCNAGWQNSYQEMLWLFGPGVPDAVPPTVTIDAPADGAVLPYPAVFDLVVTIADNQSPQLVDTFVFFDDVEVLTGTFVATTLKFPVDGGVDPGPHTIRVEASDEDGNLGMAEISIQVGEGGGGTSGGGSTSGAGTTSGEASGTGATSGMASTGGLGGGSGGDTDGSAGTAASDEGCACRSAGSQGAPLNPASWALLFVPWLSTRRIRRRPS
ncbi:MAG: hypothetical protein D6705_01180 [Deltaproteobacteria bacterium]|nr:MAG: hypothetical protein D6705_01180 [Deltaproteobacteria bacterium]